MKCCHSILFAATAVLGWAAFTRADEPAAPVFEDKGAEVGEQLPDLPLRSLDNEPVSLFSKIYGPTLIVTSSFTCPKSRANYPSLDALRTRYKDKLNILILYVIEAHPAGDPSPYRNGKEDVTPQNQSDGILRRQPATIEKRIALANEFSARFAAKIPILVDGMNNFGWESVGAGPNMAILVGGNGHVIARQGWFNAKALLPEIDRVVEATAARPDDYLNDADRQLGAQIAKEKLFDEGVGAILEDARSGQLRTVLATHPGLEHFAFPYQPRGDQGGRTLLQYAVELDHPVAVKILLNAGADAQQFTPARPSALHLAAAGGNDEILALLLPHVKEIDLRQNHGPTPLQEALFHQHPETAAVLVKAGARENFFTHVARGDTAQVAAAIAEDPSIAGRPDGLYRTPLCYAAASGRTEIARILVAAGAPTRVPGGRLASLAVPLALEYHHIDTLGWLLANGADANAGGGYGEDPLHLAAAQGDATAVRLLLKAGADIHKLDPMGFNPLHDAARAGQAAVIPLLLDAGLDINALTGIEDLPCGPPTPESRMATPLILAAGSGSVETVKALLARHADVTISDVEYHTALHAATTATSDADDAQIAQVLIDAGIAINGEDVDGKTALDLARDNKRKAIIALLLKHGARPGSGIAREQKPVPKEMGERPGM